MTMNSNNNSVLISGMANMRQSQNSEGIHSVESSVENPDMYGQNSNGLHNLDISVSNFMKVMNFEAMKGSNENEDYDGVQGEYDAYQEQYDEQPSLEQHSMDMSVELQNDLLEQQQALEQAKLLHRFKEFTSWQQQQQKLLMAQQQQELLQLRGEQERVQRMIAQQRQMQAAGTNPNQGNSMRSPPKVRNGTGQISSPRRTAARNHSSVPQAFSHSAAAMSNREGQNSGYKGSMQPSHSTQAVNGRPAPVLPDRPPTPDEYRETGNPNLDSDTNTISSIDTRNIEDDFCSIPDNISEVNGLQQPLSYTSGHNGFPMNGSDSRNSKLQEGLPNVFPQSTFPNAGLFGQAQQMQLQLLNQIASQSGLALPHQFMPRGKLPNGAFNLPSLNAGQQQPRALHPGFLQNLMYRKTTQCNTHDTSQWDQNPRQHVSHRNGLEIQDEFVLEKSKFSTSKKLSPPRERNNGLKSPQRQHHPQTLLDESALDMEEENGAEMWEEEEDVENLEEADEDFGEEEEHSAEEEEDENAQAVVDEDERPIGGTQQKTFEQLLEEELRKEEERMKGGNKEPQGMDNSSGKRPFLRRGEGIARFTVSNSAKTRSQRKERKVERPTHSAPPGGRSDRKPKRTSTTPTASNPEKNSSAPRRLTNPSKPAENPKTKPSVNKIVANKKPVPPSEPKKSATRAPLKKTSPKQSSVAQPRPKKDTDSLGDVSFQNRITAKAEEEECEAEELEEFEILEELADDDVSFISNVSTVNKVVSQLKENKNVGTQDSLVKQQIHKPKQVTHQQQNIQMLQQLQQRKQKQQELAVLNAKLKSLTQPVAQTNSGDIGHRVNVRQHPLSDSDSSEDEGLNEKPSVPKDQQAKLFPQRKIVSLKERSPNKITNFAAVEKHESKAAASGTINRNQDELGYLQKVVDFSDSDDGQSDNCDRGQSDKHESDESEDEDNDSFVVKNVHVHTKNHDTNDRNNNENLANDNRNNRTSVTTGSQSSHSSNVLEVHSQSNSTRGPSPISNALSSSTGSGTLKFDHQNGNAELTDISGPEVKPSPTSNPSNGFDFGDEEEWGDTSQADETNTTLTEDHRQSAELTDSLSTKTDGLQGAKGSSPKTQPQPATPPPTSKLVSRLFPNLKQEANKLQKTEQVVQQQKVEVTRQTNGGDGVQSKMLRDKLMELETEIERFRSENAALTKLRKEREEGLSNLHKEMGEFEKQKEAELKRLNDFKTEETKKLKKERKLFDQYQKAARAMPDKKERDEIESLKKQVTDLQEEMKRKEQRWTSSTTRLRDRIENIETENKELKEEIRILEKKRLEAWQQRDLEKKSVSTALNSNPPLKKEDYRKAALAPTPQQQPSRASDRDNALRLSSNMEELKAAMGGFSVRELDDSVMSTEVEDHDQSFDSKPSPTKNKDAKVIPRKKAQVFNVTNTVDRGDGEYEENTLPDGKIEKVYSNGSREIMFPNGTRKQISSDGQSVIVSFFNGDMKQIMSDQRVVYYYSEAQTTHTTYPDGLEILQFPNNQIEKHYPDGTREISFPDNTIKYLFPSGIEESIFEDGTVIRVEKSGDKTMEFPNGQREVHTADYKRREYPDGTVKTVYPDGKQETRYSSGRIRVKDKEGNVIVDKRM